MPSCRQVSGMQVYLFPPLQHLSAQLIYVIYVLVQASWSLNTHKALRTFKKWQIKDKKIVQDNSRRKSDFVVNIVFMSLYPTSLWPWWRSRQSLLRAPPCERRLWSRGCRRDRRGAGVSSAGQHSQLQHFSDYPGCNWK